MKNEIILKQKPIIDHKINEIGKSVSERIEALNLDKLVATEDTIKSLKSTRAELNHEVAEYKNQWKEVYDLAFSPLKDIKDIFKAEITDKFSLADSKLKETIGSHEDKVKRAKKEAIELYFNELCVSEKIDFVSLDQLNLKIDLSTSEKKYKEQCNSFISKITEEVELIKTTDFEAEIMAEYKVSLNAAASIKGVKDRKERERTEKERIKFEESARRTSELLSIACVYKGITKTYDFNEDIFVSSKDVESATKEEFSKIIIELKHKIKLFKESEIKPSVEKLNQVVDNTEEKTKQVVPQIKAPLVEKKEEIVTASFEVTGTMSELRGVGKYMKERNINYKNI